MIYSPHSINKWSRGFATNSLMTPPIPKARDGPSSMLADVARRAEQDPSSTSSRQLVELLAPVRLRYLLPDNFSSQRRSAELERNPMALSYITSIAPPASTKAYLATSTFSKGN